MKYIPKNYPNNPLDQFNPLTRKVDLMTFGNSTVERYGITKNTQDEFQKGVKAYVNGLHTIKILPYKEYSRRHFLSLQIP